MSLTVSVRSEYVNTKKYNFQLSHDRRERKKPAHWINPEMSRSNSRIFDKDYTGKDLLEIARSLREKAYEKGLINRKTEIKDDSPIAYRGVITFGKEAQEIIKELSVEKQNELYLEIARRISRAAGAPLLSVYAHRDEQAPHAHYTMFMFDENGKKIRLQRQDLRRFQDIASNVCQEFGLPISRGIPKEQRIAAGAPTYEYLHKTVAELHYSLPTALELKEKELKSIEADLERRRQELDDIKRAIEDMEKAREERLKGIEDKQRLLQKAKKELEELVMAGKAESEKAKKLEKRIATYESRLSNYEKEIAEKERVIGEKQEEIDKTLKALEVYNKMLVERRDKVDETDRLKSENAKLKAKVERLENDIIKFGSRLNKVLEKASDRTKEVVEKAIERAAFESPTIDLLLNAFYGELEAQYMRE